MHTSGIEDLKASLRRSVWLIIALVLVGIVAVNGLMRYRGPEYEASARVLLSTTDLAANLAGIQSVYVDPDRRDEAERNIASAPPLFAFAAERAGGALGTGRALDSATKVSVRNNAVAFTSSSSDAGRAAAVANAVASAYPDWRAQTSRRAIDAALSQLRAAIRSSGDEGGLADELQRLQVLKTLNSGDTFFVEPARGAERTTPKLVKDSMMGAAIGLVVALLLVGIRELLDTTIRSEGDVESALGAPVLATIHALPRRLRSTVLGSGQQRHTDEYDLLAANVAQMFDGHDESVYIAVTSAVPGEGKTTTAANLATALARRGESIVLVDFDLRKPAVSALFALPKGAPGVKDLLSGFAQVDSTLWDVPLNGDGFAAPGLAAELTTSRRRRSGVGVTQEGSLTVLPGGGGPSRHAPPAQFARLPALLSEIEHDADFVVIDTPPALLVPGMAELGQRVDGVLVVVRQGAVSRRRLRSLGQQASSWRARVLGAVLNDVPQRDRDRYYGSYYGSA